MCLFIKSRIPRIALHNIVVFKEIDDKKDYWNPVWGSGNFLYCKKIKAKGNIFKVLKNIIHTKTITIGFFHSCDHLNTVSSWAFIDNLIYTVCVIPKGTIYYKNDTMYASRKLIVYKP